MHTAHKSAAETGLKPGSRLAVVLGIVGLSIGITLRFIIPRQFTYIHFFVTLPTASLGALCCGVGILVSWRRISWPLRVLGILIALVGASPLTLFSSMLIKGFMNWPTPEQLELKQP